MKGFGIKYLNDELIITPRFKENQFDNFMYEDSQFSIGLEGVVLNSSQLKEQTASLNLGELLITLYSDNQQLFLQQLSGEFCGWLWDKYANKLFVFTNYTGTRKVFYSYKNQHLIADTDLLNMVNYQKAHGYRPVLDIDYAYSLLTVGNTLENQTPIKEIKKLRDAEMICLNMNRNTLENSFYTLVYPKFMGSKKEAIKGLHQRFQKAVRLEYEKDSELGLKTVALLSGGLDSRIALFSAMQQGFKIDQVVCFSQKGYWDEKIAKQIATDYNLPLQCIYLNGGEYLVSIDEVTSISDGMVRYTGGIHTNFAFKSVDKKNVGLIHGGQLGNDVLGGFNPKAYQASPTTEKIIQFPRYFEKSQDFFNQVIAEYDSEELFYYRNLGYNFSVIGSYVAEEFSYQTAPFMHPEFLAFSQSLPEEWKMDHAIYIEWVSLCFPEATHYRWERTLLRPNAKWKTKFGDKVVKRMYNLILNRIFKRNDLGQMTAYEFYFDENDAIKNELHQYYHKNIGLLDTEIELQKDIREIFNKGLFWRKNDSFKFIRGYEKIFCVKDLMKFLQDFINNKGIIVFLSIIVEKLVALINTIFVVRMITAEDYGLLTIIATLYGVFMTMNGLGSVQGLMRFGSIEKTKETRDQLANYIFKLGLKRHILLTIVFFLISMINELKYPSIWTIIIFFVIRMIGAYFYSFILSYYRIQNENNLFALIGIKINGIGLFITLILTYYLGVYGYLLGLVITPWLALLFLNRKIFIGHYALPLNYNSKTFWNYSLNSSITYFLSEMLFLIDVFLISLFLDELAVAQYKVAIILPMNLMFLPLIFMQTDYPKLSKNYQDKAYLLFYIKNYYKVFIPLCLLILLIGYLLKDWLLVFFFGQAYADNGQVLFVILIAVTMNMCFKNLYSNLLSAVGRAKSNSIVSIVSLVIMVALSLILIPIYGVLGAAIALAITFILTGFLSAYYFRNYLNSL